MKPLCIAGFHKSTTSEVFKAFRDNMPDTKVYRTPASLFDAGEVVIHSEQVFHQRFIDSYPSAPEDVAAVRQLLEQIPDNYLVKVVGHPYSVCQSADKLCVIFLRRAIEDVIYLNFYKSKWMHILQLAPETRPLYEDWSATRRVPEDYLVPVIQAFIKMERYYHSHLPLQIWRDQVFSEPEHVQKLLAAEGYNFQLPPKHYLEARCKSLVARDDEIRSTPEWKKIKKLVGKYHASML